MSYAGQDRRRARGRRENDVKLIELGEEIRAAQAQARDRLDRLERNLQAATKTIADQDQELAILRLKLAQSTGRETRSLTGTATH